MNVFKKQLHTPNMHCKYAEEQGEIWRITILHFCRYGKAIYWNVLHV